MNYISTKKSHKKYGICSDCKIEVPRKETKRCSQCASKFRTLPLAKRIMRHIKKSKTCWEWMGYRNPQGYGAIGVDGKARPVHRVMYELKKSPIPKGLLVCHSCDNPPCVNPDHLWLGTHYENRQDAVKKGRVFIPAPPRIRSPGEDNANAKLTWEIVRLIREEYNRQPDQNISALGRAFGLKTCSIFSIVKNRQWKD